MIFFLFLAPVRVSSCNPACKSEWLGNNICNLECMSEPCQFDLGDCLVECAWSGCTKTSADGVCDKMCRSNVCGFDFGDCGYCTDGCTKKMFSNWVCDLECNTKECLFDNNFCGECASGCFTTMKSNLKCENSCFNYECGWDNMVCSVKECANFCKVTMVGDGICNTACNVTECSFDGGDCDCAPGCNGALLSNGKCDTVCNNTLCFFDNYDCYCDVNCTHEMQFNSVCDPGCNTTSCQIDMGNCICPPECTDSMLGDLNCDSACNNSACFYDKGDCSCAPGCSYHMISDGVYNPECYVPECWYDGLDNLCSDSCLPEMLYNFACDDGCNTQNCSYDNHQCYCSLGCTPEMKENSICELECFNQDCGYDGGACNCGQFCYPYMIADNICDLACNISQCSFDGGDCSCSDGCSELELIDNVCTPACDNQNCNYDYFKCGECNSGCFNSMLGDKFCDNACNTFSCEYDFGDCSEVFYYFPSENRYRHSSSIDWSSTDPEAYFQFINNYGKVKVYMLGGNYDFLNTTMMEMLVFIYDDLIIEPLYCSESLIEGCFLDNEVPIYGFFMRMSFTIYTSVTFKSQVFTSYHGNPSYQEVDYCRAIIDYGWIINNDQGSEVTEKYLNSKVCDFNSQSSFFTLFGERLSFKNVEFKNMRLKYNSLIYVIKGELLMENVNFINIVVAPGSAVIKTSTSYCEDTNRLTRFVYKGGVVKFINNGYELNYWNDLAGFLSISCFKEAIIQNVNFTMNLFSYSRLFYFSGFFRLELNEILVEHTASNMELIEIELRHESELLDLEFVDFNFNNLLISNSEFSYLVGTRIFNIYSRKDYSNIVMENNTFSNIEAISQVISIYDLQEYCEKCSVIPYPFLPKNFKLKNTIFESNFAYENLLVFYNLKHILLDSVDFLNNRYYPVQVFNSILTKIRENQGYAITNPFYFEAENQNLIQISLSEYVNFTNLNFEGNFCRLGSLSVSKYFEFNNSHISNSSLTYYDSLFTFAFSDNGKTSNDPTVPAVYKFFNITAADNNYQNKINSVFIIQALVFEKVSFENIEFLRCSNGIRTAGVRNLELTGVRVINSASEIASGIEFSPFYDISKKYSEAFLTVDKAYLEGSGNFLYVTPGPSMTLFLTLTRSEFVNNFDSILVILSNSISLAPGSSIKSSEFKNNKRMIFYMKCTGTLTLFNNSFIGNSDEETVVLSPDINLALLIDSNKFSLNAGQQLILAVGKYDSSQLVLSNNIFEYTTGTSITLSKMILNDNGSIFRHNVNSFASVLKACDKASAIFENSAFVNNSASLFGNIVLSLRSEVNLQNITASNNRAVGKGGFLFTDENSTFIISDSIIEKSSGSQGSCIYSHYSYNENQIINTKFISNDAKKSGCINIVESLLIIKNSMFKSNTGKSASDLFVTSQSLISIQSTVFDNLNGKGTSLFVDSNSEVSVKGCKFLNNFYRGTCEALMIFNSRLNVEGSFFRTGSAECLAYCENSKCNFLRSGFEGFTENLEGALIMVESNTFLNLTSVNISNFEGTALHIGINSNLSLLNSSIQNGNASQSPGIFCTDCKVLSISSSTFSNLESSSKGGAIFAHNDKSLIQISINSSSFNSSASSTGGALYLSNSKVNIKNSSFSQNYAFMSNFSRFSGQGGAIFLVSNLEGAYLIVNQSQFWENQADVSGGAIQWYDFPPLLVDVDFQENFAFYGKDLASYACKVKIADGESLPIETAPGANLTRFFFLDAIDHYDNLVTTESSSVLAAASVDTEKFTLAGSLKFKALNGKFNISQIVIRGIPGSDLNVSFSTIFEFSNSKSESFEIVEFHLRECIIGEALKGDDSCVRCAAGTYNYIAGTECKKCPTGAKCYGGSDMVSALGYWRTDNRSEIFYECPLAAACLEEQLNDVQLEKKCEKGYTGRLCQGCEQGYSRDGQDHCAQCGDQTTNIVVISFIMITGGLAIFVLTASTINSAYKEQSITSVYFKILTNYTQIVALTISFNLEWPTLVKKMFEVQKQAVGASDRLFSIDCLLKSHTEPYFAKLMLINFMPIGFSILSTLYWLTKSLLFKTPDLKSKIIGSITVQVFFFLASITKVNFSMFNCMEIGNHGSFLVDDMTIKCWDKEHYFYVVSVTVPCIVFWCFFVPILIVILLYKKRTQLKTTKELLKFGFLHKGFHMEYFYWEFVILFRKIGIISCSVFMRSISIHVQALTTFMVILVAFTFHLKAKPYNAEQLNSMETRSILVCGVTIYCGLYFMTNVMDSLAKFFLFLLMVLINALFISYWIYYTFGYYITMCLLKINAFKTYVHRKHPHWVNKMIASGKSNTEEEKEESNSKKNNQKIDTDTIECVSPSNNNQITSIDNVKVNNPRRKHLKLAWVNKVQPE